MAEKARETETRGALAPYRPFAGLTRWEREMDRMMDEFFGRRMRGFWPERWLGGDSETIEPVVDVYEEKDDIVVKAELPGMEKNDIEVSISDSQFILKGEKRKEEKAETEDYYKCERSFGAFFRVLDLPSDIQADKVKASFKNGVLEVRLPKSEEAKSKQLKIKVE
jgi:HSP20 family protein